MTKQRTVREQMSESCFLSCLRTICVVQKQNNDNMSFYLGASDKILWYSDYKQPLLAKVWNSGS